MLGQRANFADESNCGMSVSSATGQIQINGLATPPEYAFDNLTLVQTQAIGGSNNVEILLTGTFRSLDPTGNNVSAIIDLPENLTLTGNNAGSQLTFTQIGQRLTATLPSSGQPAGTTSSFSINLEPTNLSAWTTETHYIYLRVGKESAMTCNGTNCTVMAYSNAVDSVPFSLQLEELEVCFSDNITVTSHYIDPQNEHVIIEGWLVNNGTLDADLLTIEWCYFDGVDYVPVSDVIGSLSIADILQGDSVAFSIQANIPYTQNVCNMWLLLRKPNSQNILGLLRSRSNSQNASLAEDCFLQIPVPTYEITNQPDPICQLSGNTPIGDLAITGYSYN